MHVRETNRMGICVRKTIKKITQRKKKNKQQRVVTVNSSTDKNLIYEDLQFTSKTSISFFSNLYVVIFLRRCRNRYYLPTTIYRRESISETLMRYWYCSIIWYIYFYGGHYSPFYFLSFFLHADTHKRHTLSI